VNRLKEKIKNRERTYGTHVFMSDPCICDIVGRLGYDFIWIDMEHCYSSYKDVLNHITAAHAAGTAAVVRVPQDDLTATKKVLEMGPDGIIFPMVRTAEEANRLIANTLYPPYGTRGYGPMAANQYGIVSGKEYATEGHLDICRFIQIEHKDAVDNLEEITKNEFIDGYIFGPCDLSASINEIMQTFEPHTNALIERAIKILKSKNKYIGLSTAPNEKNLKYCWDIGIDMLSCGIDYELIRDGAKDVLKLLHKCGQA